VSGRCLSIPVAKQGVVETDPDNDKRDEQRIVAELAKKWLGTDTGDDDDEAEEQFFLGFG
jgi:hypothetical protein